MDFEVKYEIKLGDQIFDSRYHPNSASDLIAAATISGNVHLIENGSIKSKLKRHHKGSSIRKIRFTDDGQMVTIAKAVKLHDLVANKTSHTLKRGDEKRVSFYSVKPFGNNIISAGDDDGGLFVWDTRTPTKPIFSACDCEQYISDIDGRFESRRIMLCTSGEGTLTAYDMRAMKMIEPQSELFEAGFQCMKLDEINKKVVIGGEDGALYVFNHNEWAHTSGKYAIASDVQNRGKCSIDCIDSISDSSIYMVGCSDGRVRCLTLWPHQVISESVFCKRASLESIHVNPKRGRTQLVISGENHINIVEYRENNDRDSDDDMDQTELPVAGDGIVADAVLEASPKTIKSKESKLKTDTEDYLNIFS